jgi:hypothetical protein
VDVGGGIYIPQSSGSGDVARECARCRLPFYATCERDSRKVSVAAKTDCEKARRRTPHLNPLPASGARRRIADANAQKAVGITGDLREQRHAYLPSLKSQIPNPNSQTNLKLENPKKDNYAIFKVTKLKNERPFARVAWIHFPFEIWALIRCLGFGF